MKILVTGAAGFLGTYVVRSALAAGYEVRALVRASSTWPGSLDPDHCAGLEIVTGDLRDRDKLGDIVDVTDAVIHLAATMTGDFYSKFSGTVITTENLLDAMRSTRIRRLIMVSSLAVYDYNSPCTGALIDENSPLESRPDERDDYCKTKLVQEQLAVRRSINEGIDLTIIRPGMIFGPHKLWSSRLGRQLLPNLWICTGANARVPLTYVENCADAIVSCLDSPDSVGRTFVIVDDECPTQRQFVRLLRQLMDPKPRVVPINFTLLRIFAEFARHTNNFVFNGRAKLPLELSTRRLLALIKPLRYSNSAIKAATSWKPRVGLEEALDRSFQI